ncbi:gamma-glutamylputrescine oxidoreductase [Colletotrichum spaethianum]|uniref:Gamma-glutamylputrescine oxidoreductase n=1 Tax=Colletotrichum spaethianum TaxID=700344 RepID=A0AA37PDV1_9PEZI|nr:gamma-glutamylputrescine oxidoreductase [Colletotrichum spaethianum]GKT50398.1 gamma-glutamylputrescine oxidoreductase [Colletotrichum spaethianum]
MTGETLRPGQADLPSAKSTASYWHREPSEALLGHRTTKALPPTADVVVVGSGITGAFATKELLEQQAGSGTETVLLLEAREVCWGATGRNGGHCQPIAYNPNTAIADFELRNYAHLADFVAANAVPCDWLPLRGVHALLTPDLVAAAEKQIAALPPHLAGLARLVTDPGELRTLRVPDAAGAVVQERAASVWPYRLVTWIFEDLLRRFGPGSRAETQSKARRLNIQTNTPVTRLQHLPGSSSASPGEASWVVHTDRGQVAAKKVLLASNAYTSRLLPSFADLIVPVRGQVAALLPEPRAELGRSYVFMASSDASKGEPNQDDYLIQRPSPGLEMILGGGRARGALRGVGVSDDDEIDPVVAAYLRRAGAANVELGDGEKKEELRASYEWTGIMAFSRDGRPWVGPVPSGSALGGGEGLWVCAGYTGHGMPQAALCGRAVAGMMAGSQGAGKDAVDVPAEFLVSDERAAKARALPSIKEMDELDMFLL